MADYVYTADTILIQSGNSVIRKAAEAIAEGDWVYESTAGTEVSVASKDDAAKDKVIGQAIRGGVTGTHIVIALGGCVVNVTATPAIAVGDWLVLSVGGNTSPVADQGSGDEVTGVAQGCAVGQYKIKLENTGKAVA